MITPDVPPTVAQEAPPPALLDPAVVAAQVSAPTAEQIQASDQVFSQPEDYSTVAGLAGLWTSIILLHDLAAEHLQAPSEEEVEREKQRKTSEAAAEG